MQTAKKTWPLPVHQSKVDADCYQNLRCLMFWYVLMSWMNSTVNLTKVARFRSDSFAPFSTSTYPQGIGSKNAGTITRNRKHAQNGYLSNQSLFAQHFGLWGHNHATTMHPCDLWLLPGAPALCIRANFTSGTNESGGRHVLPLFGLHMKVNGTLWKCRGFGDIMPMIGVDGLNARLTSHSQHWKASSRKSNDAFPSS